MSTLEISENDTRLILQILSEASEWIPAKTARAMLGVREQTLRNAVTAGKIEAKPFGGKYMYRRLDCERYARLRAGSKDRRHRPNRRN